MINLKNIEYRCDEALEIINKAIQAERLDDDDYQVIFKNCQQDTFNLLAAYKEALSLLEEATEELENIYGRDTELTDRLRNHLNGVDIDG